MTDTPTPIMAAVVFTEGGGFELRPLQGCTAEDVAVVFGSSRSSQSRYSDPWVLVWRH
jgi:hypothetical protein